MTALGRRFFAGDTLDVARRLLGCILVRVVGGGRVAGRIVELEAYCGTDDPAGHAFRGMTQRNAVMFGEPGHAYVYFTMGMHWCLNVTTEKKGTPGAVLVRALEPLEGVGFMIRERGTSTLEELTAGPAKLTKALRIDGRLNGEDLTKSRRLFLERGPRVKRPGVSSRVGISEGTERRWRFYVRGSRFVSKGKPSARRRIHN